jgi:hypothetical protein
LKRFGYTDRQELDKNIKQIKKLSRIRKIRGKGNEKSIELKLEMQHLL